MAEELDIKDAEVLPTALSGDDLVKMADAAEARVEAVKRIKKAALAVTTTNDWMDQHGKPYLQASGSKKVGRLFGVSWQLEPAERTDEPDGGVSFTFEGLFSLGTATITAIGARSSKDEFFSRQKSLDLNDVKKAAYTNCIGNGVTSILGITGLTWDDLKEAGISAKDTARVEYKDDKAKQARAEGKISGAQASRLHAIAGERSDETGIPKKDLVDEALAAVYGDNTPDSTTDILKSDYKNVVEKLESLTEADIIGVPEVEKDES